ncbi:hypothetical protein STBA_51330 [Streptomyces sp. MP131-18]|nr:hypothetical protein STBA_51330 [Streptomyces sp. MP131-18]
MERPRTGHRGVTESAGGARSGPRLSVTEGQTGGEPCTVPASRSSRRFAARSRRRATWVADRLGQRTAVGVGLTNRRHVNAAIGPHALTASFFVDNTHDATRTVHVHRENEGQNRRQHACTTHVLWERSQAGGRAQASWSHARQLRSSPCRSGPRSLDGLASALILTGGYRRFGRMSTHPEAPTVRHRRRRKAVIRAAGGLAESADLYVAFPRIAGCHSRPSGVSALQSPSVAATRAPWSSPPTPRQPARASPSSWPTPSTTAGPASASRSAFGHPDTAIVGSGFAYWDIDMTRVLRDSLTAAKGSGTHRPGSRLVARTVRRTGPDTPSGSTAR